VYALEVTRPKVAAFATQKSQHPSQVQVSHAQLPLRWQQRRQRPGCPATAAVARPVLDAAASPFTSHDGYTMNKRIAASGMRVSTKLKLFSGSANPVRAFDTSARAASSR
jgi:hypothetical protein